MWLDPKEGLLTSQKPGKCSDKYSLEEGIKKYIEDYQTLGSSII